MKRFLFLLGLAITALQARAYDLYVAPTGSDQNSGTIASPLQTLSAARDLLRSLRSSGSLPSGTVTVWLRQGSYDQPATLALTSADSGSAGSPVVYSSYPGEEAHITGAVTLDPTWFTLVTSSSAIWGRLDPAAQGQVYQVDLGAHGITDWGTLQVRGFGLRAPAALELFFNGQAMTLARWPNVGAPLATTNATTSSTQFTYTGTRPSRWTQATDIWMQGFWSQDWADYHLPVASISPSSSTVTLASAPPQYGLGAARPFYAYNLLEELDTPGEYYLDRTSGLLYYWPTAPLAGSAIQASMLSAPVVTFSGTSYVTFHGVLFEAARGPLVTITDGNNNTLDHCLLRNAGQWGAQVSGSSNGLTHCQITDCGEEGVRVSGGDRASLTPGNNYVTHSQIHSTGRIDWTYKPAINLEDGCGNIATNNLIDDLPHVAILFTGNNHLIAYNEIWHVCQTTGDSGAIYCGRNWGYRGNVIEYNYLHDISSSLGSADVNGIYLDDCMSGVSVYSNLFYQISGTALFCGGGRDNLMTNNLIAYCGTAHYNDDRGRTMIDNVNGDAWNLLQTLGADTVQYNQGVWAVAYPALAMVPDSWTALQQGLWRNPQNCVFSHNAGWGNAAWTFESDSSGTGVFSVYASLTDNNSQVNALFTAAAAEDRSLRPVTVTSTDLSSFTPVPFAAIGPDLSAEPAATVAPSLPRLTAASASSSSVTLQWTTLSSATNSAATSFALQSASGSGWTTLQTCGGEVDFWTVPGLAASSTYTFEVVATNAAGASTSNTVTVTTAAAPLQTGAVVRIEAESPLNVVTDKASNGTVGVSDAMLDSGASVRMYDAGDAIQMNFTIATAGTYELGLRVRSGGSTGPTAFWPSGYTATLDGTAVAVVGDPTTLSALDPSYGGCFWGTMVSAPLTLTAGSHSVILTAQSNWAVADYLDVTALVPAAATAAVSVATSTASTTPTIAPDSSDVGSVNVAGSSSYANGVYTLTGAGADIWNSTVGFHFSSQTMTGDGVITARIVSLQDTDGWAKAGVMFRDSDDPQAAYAALFITAGNGAALQWGAGNGAASGSTSGSGGAPYWVQLARTGSTFTAATSADGVTWTTVGIATVTLGQTVSVGLAVTSHNAGELTTAVFDSVSLLGSAVTAESTTSSTTTATTPATPATTATTATSTSAITTSTAASTSAAASTPASTAATSTATTTASSAAATASTSAASTPATTTSAAGLFTSVDVGTVSIAGSATVSSAGVYQLIGSGADIWNSTVGFQYDYQALNGDGVIIARVTSLQNTDSWAKAGVMIRETTGAQAAYAAVFLTGSNGVAFQGGAGNGASSWSAGAYGSIPDWVRLTRSGNTFTADCSADGVTWTNVGNATVAMGANVCVGLCVTSHNPGAAATATFDSVSVNGAMPVTLTVPTVPVVIPATPVVTAPTIPVVTPTAPVITTPVAAAGTLAAPWLSGDIGSVGIAGSTTVSNGVYSVTGSGPDIWNSSIGFQYAWQTMAGDGTITARLTSVQNTDGWTKAGIMIRADSDTTAPYAALFATPGNGVAFQWRNVDNWDCGSQGAPNPGLPTWLRLTRSGDTVTAYVSADGATWTNTGTVSLPTGGTFTFGLAVGSHNNGATALATFDSVTLQSAAP